MPNTNRHKNYDLLNLIGYGLSKFDTEFIKSYGFKTKSDFYQHIVNLGVAETVGVVKNRQDLFDGMEPGGKRKGWWQKGLIYKHRKDYVDSLFGNLNCKEYVDIVKLSIAETLEGSIKKEIAESITASPFIRSSFKQIQETGREAEYYFLNNYQMIETFTEASISDARLLGDGYDFQLTLMDKYFLAEVKGLKQAKGNIRMTQKEYERAIEYKADYVLVIVRNLIEIPVFYPVFDPVNNLHFEEKCLHTEQVNYYSAI